MTFSSVADTGYNPSMSANTNRGEDIESPSPRPSQASPDYAAMLEAAQTEPSREVASWVKPEDLYANPGVLDRSAYERTLGTAEPEYEYHKTVILGDNLEPDQVAHDYDAETDIPLMNEWDRPEVDLQAELNSRQKPFMEFGGPTYDGFQIIEGLQMPQKVLVSNIEPGYPLFVDGRKRLVGRVDQVADITEMPLENESLGAVFASAIHADLHAKALAEAARVLEPGGLIFWQNGKAGDLELAKDAGLEVVRFMSALPPRSRPKLSFVFRKPTAD